MGRLGTVAEMADVIVFAASPRAHWINGRNIRLMGWSSRTPRSIVGHSDAGKIQSVTCQSAGAARRPADVIEHQRQAQKADKRNQRPVVDAGGAACGDHRVRSSAKRTRYE
jgi:hypothetical protein